ncbi:MAG: dihydroorotase [Candidatus Freyarchaeota archaeon]
MTLDLLIRNATFPWRGQFVKGNIAVRSGKIVKLFRGSCTETAERVINAENRVVLPGLIDVHVHLRDLEQSYKEDYHTGTCAAAAGGITTVLDMPNTRPKTDSAEVLKFKKKLAQGKAMVNVGFFSLFPSRIDEIPKIIEEGAVAFKVYPQDPESWLTGSLPDRLKSASKFGKPVAVHPEEKVKDEYNTIQQFLQVHSINIEFSAVIRYTLAAERAQCHLHLCHITSKRTVEYIRTLKASYPRVSCEVTPHHLLLTRKHIEEKGALLKVLPPLRENEDLESLWLALNQGIIDVIASDHAPHQKSEKEKSISDASPGFPGLETTLSLMLTQVNAGRISLKRLVEVLSENPAKIFKIKSKGKIEEGYDADLTIIDLKAKGKINPDSFYSKAKYSPFEGWTVKGKPITTIVNGVVVMEHGEIIAPKGVGSVLTT